MTARPTQPISAPSGGAYGQRKALEDAQAQIPLPNNSPQATRGPSRAAPTPVPRPNVFGPTERPNEAITAGAAVGAGPSSLGMLPDDPLEFLRAIQMQFPSPGIARLLERQAMRGR